MMKSQTGNKAVICSLLLLIMCGSNIPHLLTNVNQSSQRVDFVFLSEDGSIDFDHNTPFSKKLNWYLKGLSTKIIPLVLIAMFLIKPPFPQWLWLMWFCFFTISLIDWVLFYEQWPWRRTVDGGMLITQFIWCIDYIRRN